MELRSSDFTSVKYHDIFDFKLTKEEAVRWQYKNQKVVVSGRKNKSRLQREKYSLKKLVIARNASKLISKIPTVLFIGITGSLAMMNSSRESDIDLMIITKKNWLWTTRLLSYLVTWLLGFKTRRPKDNLEKDKLCLNIWLDESDLVWGKNDRNIYTAHEIAQIVPLFNKNKTYEKVLYLNHWILSFWPRATKVISNKDIKILIVQKTNHFISIYFISWLIEKIAFELQYFYMKSKITREVVTPTRAIFHPNDWGRIVIDKLGVDRKIIKN